MTAADSSGRSIAASWLAGVDITRLRDGFERDHHIVVPGLVRRELWDRVCREVDAGRFEEWQLNTGHTELCMRSTRAVGLMDLFVSDPLLFEAVRRMTGSGRIGAFVGRIYRMLPGSRHEGTWHGDNVEGRLVAMSVNLSDADYSGGLLEIRERDSQRVLHRIANTGPGDAVIFRIAPELQHRVSAVGGDAAKTSYAGWFVSDPDSALIRPGDFLRPEATEEGIPTG